MINVNGASSVRSSLFLRLFVAKVFAFDFDESIGSIASPSIISKR